VRYEAIELEVVALRREVRELRAIVGHLVRQRASDDRLGPLLAAIYAFAGPAPWTARELLADAARADKPLWLALAAIVGRADPGICLGRWLERHDGAAAGGYRLERLRREANAWLYVVRLESGESLS
jgi:hypothetical protein